MIARGFGRIVQSSPSSAVKAPIDILALSNGARSGPDRLSSPACRAVPSRTTSAINNLLPGQFDTDRLRAELRAQCGQGRQCSLFGSGRTPPPADPRPARFGTADEFGAACAFLCSCAGRLPHRAEPADRRRGAYPGTFLRDLSQCRPTSMPATSARVVRARRQQLRRRRRPAARGARRGWWNRWTTWSAPQAGGGAGHRRGHRPTPSALMKGSAGRRRSCHRAGRRI